MRTRAPRLIGRDPESARLAIALEQTRAGNGGSFFLSGEPGIGKTRLAADTIGSALDAGMVVLRGRGSTTGPAVPFRPLTEALLSLVRTADPGLPARLGPYRPVLGRLVPDWADENSRGGESLVVLAEGVLRLTALAGAASGCVLYLDDLHDADVETLAVLEYLCGNVAGLPTMVLATVRSEPSDALDLAETAARRDEAHLLSLQRLGTKQVHELVCGCLDAEPTEVPEAVSGLLFDDSAGNPLVVEELLHELVSGGSLVRDRDGWRLAEETRAVPQTLVNSIGRRVDRLGPRGAQLLSVAAVLGQRFPLSVVQRVTGLDDHALLSHLRAAVAAQLLSPDERGADWYGFQHPLAVDGLLTRLTPADRAQIARSLADAVLELHPDLPREWCHLAAGLRAQAGEHRVAGQLYLRAGRRALDGGAPGTAIALLERAEPSLTEHGTAAERGDLLETMLFALAESGQFDRARELAETLRTTTALGDDARRIEVCVRLAWAAQVAGRWADGDAQVRAARALLPLDATEEQTVPVDAVDAYLTMFGTEPGRVHRGELLARRALDGAERIGRPATACQAWYAIGLAVRERNLRESDACFQQMLDLAAKHELATWRNYALTGLAGNAWLAEGDTTALDRARAESLRTGGISLAHNADAILGLHSVLCGDFRRATEQLDTCLAESARMQLTAVTRYVLMAKAALAGHRGDRQAMTAALAEFARQGGESSPEMPLARGLAKVFCALLEEDRPAAEAELAVIATAQAERQSTFYLAGPHGLQLLLDVLADRAGRAEHARVRNSAAGQMRWNRQFVLLAEAVLLGREGRGAEAARVRAEASRTAESFRGAKMLGLRLVAEAAVADGWGEPGAWLREAEEYFHRFETVAVASACRTLLRRAGAPVGQRRAGSERVPESLRVLGVTLREFEVYQLLVHRLANKALAERLHISPRTVEKHVASLLVKTSVADRSALADHAVETLRAHG
ncbi:helix-turn-helix transcriptional regulator [Amycolatopsis sp. 195334CR]|uniref:helix-turn-helix transcriptional regulator n=1 Tax=Amycolatopsis sp. 195334CR TaxID=2814588 RepID=UPI001A90C87F|nr:AAA family ATPase [Amycolatopsis sp. 195334CR]MBN6037607.1 AAA family ATPase [Amycolatopsis sp. 195334CR]